ncbi:DUF4386 domain-containing protein [Sunxiuqinia sp. A32]|uniref:DUF4386 domain-containing protein n=1 Tax=Sunxiuqinia sp. A32 TaxID=3461496 RepID=UPI0040455DBC
MKTKIVDINQRKAAIIAGISILVMTVAAVIATDVSIGHLYVPDSASETMKNVTASSMLFRIGVFSWLIILISDVIAAWGLYIFLKPVNKNMSLIMAWFRLIYVAILGTAIMNLVQVLSLIGGIDFAAILGTEQLQTQVLIHIKGFYDTWSLGLVVFGLHVLLLGYLLFKSGFCPKIFGVLLVLAFVGYVITNSLKLLSPEAKNITTVLEWIFIIPMLSEIALGIWLLVIGLRKSK